MDQLMPFIAAIDPTLETAVEILCAFAFLLGGLTFLLIRKALPRDVETARKLVMWGLVLWFFAVSGMLMLRFYPQ